MVQSGFLRPQQMRYDALALLQHEYRRLLTRKADQRKAEIVATRQAVSAAAAAGSGAADAAAAGAAPGFRYRTHQVCVLACTCGCAAALLPCCNRPLQAPPLLAFPCTSLEVTVVPAHACP